MKKIKLAVFDMEGTIFRKSYRFDFIKDRFAENWRHLSACHAKECLEKKEFTSAWTLLCDLLGPKPSKLNQDNWKKWTDGGYSGYSEWVIDTIRLHKEHGMTKQLFDVVVNESAVYFPGVAEAFRSLRDQGINIALVSGGLKAMADRVALDHGLEHCFASAEYFWHEDGTIRHWNCQPSDFVHKKRLVKLLLHDLGISKDECVFIGDGRNDRDVAQHVGLSVGFNPKPYHKFWWDVVVEQEPGKENLAAVLETLGKSPHISVTE
jgi:phosphoserine phosphatase